MACLIVIILSYLEHGWLYKKNEFERIFPLLLSFLDKYMNKIFKKNRTKVLEN